MTDVIAASEFTRNFGRYRPVGWEERRRRIEDVCGGWPVAGDVTVEPVDVDGLKGE